jgi:acetylornithine deacetylase/succinyl-diaminopimelate desuccinylase-like protein
LIPEARAKLSMRIVPDTDPDAELDALVRHLETHAPWGAPGHGRTHQGGRAVSRRDRRAWLRGRPPGHGSRLRVPGGGGRIWRIDPPAAHPAGGAPNAEFILWGAEDTAKARIHASDESVDPAEIEAMILAQVFLVQDLAKGRRDHG